MAPVAAPIPWPKFVAPYIEANPFPAKISAINVLIIGPRAPADNPNPIINKTKNILDELICIKAKLKIAIKLKA